MAIAFYQKYRPSDFSSFEGNEVIYQSFKNLYAKSKTDKSKYPQRFLFKGRTGCGKTTAARLLVKMMKCSGTAEERGDNLFCDKCESCLRLNKYLHTGLDEDRPHYLREYSSMRLNLEKVQDIIAEIGHDDVALYDSWSFYIFDESHALTTKSMGDLLKTFEELPPYVCVIFCTNEPEKMLDTLVNRATHTFEMFPPAESEVVRLLQRVCNGETIPYDIKALKLLVRRSDCVPRMALSALENLATQYGSVNYQNAVQYYHTTEDSYYLNFLKVLHKQNYAEYITFLSGLFNEIKVDTFTKNFSYFLDSYLQVYLGVDITAGKEDKAMAKEIFEKLFTPLEILKLYDKIKILSGLNSAEIRIELFKLCLTFMSELKTSKGNVTVGSATDVSSDPADTNSVTETAEPEFTQKDEDKAHLSGYLKSQEKAEGTTSLESAVSDEFKMMSLSELMNQDRQVSVLSKFLVDEDDYDGTDDGDDGGAEVSDSNSEDVSGFENGDNF